MKSRKIWPFILLGFCVLIFGFFASLYFFFKDKTPQEILNIPIVKNVLENRAGPEGKEFVDLLPIFLGFQHPQTYLILFLNNTEIRPGGGFIGSYATVQVSNGKLNILTVEGTESLDHRTPATWKPVPPKMIQEKLGLSQWYFRDSNWSPDYPTNVKKALEFYKAEGGTAADDVDAVVAITPVVLKKLLEITGPIKVEGIEFNSENVVEKLEYEVEYGFEKKGVSVAERKKILKPLFEQVVTKIAPDAVVNTQKYFSFFENLAQEKHVLAYFFDEKVQKILQKRGWSGEVKSTPGDFVMWVDANLGALKTDQKIIRQLSYSFTPEKKDNLTTLGAIAKMKYTHTGVYDKFTSRYLTYARVYVPEGSVLKGATLIDQNGKRIPVTAVDQGKELGKQWFGTFISVEPQQTQEVEFSYFLPASLVDLVKGGIYTLKVQKQAGLENSSLTLNLNFATNIQSAQPAEEKSEWGNSHYTYSTNFAVDKDFALSLAK